MPKILSDLTKLIFLSRNPAFKNNAVYESAVTVGGSTVPGLNTREFTIPLSRVPDLVSAMFNGPTDTVFGSDPRPGNAWFKKGAIWVRGDNAGAGYNNYPVPFTVMARISGQNAIIRLEYVQQFSDGLTLTPTNLSYRIIDYSVF